MIPYPTYKSTDLPWLPTIPERWEIKKLRNLLSSFSSKNRPEMPLLSVVREKGVVLRDVSSKEENHNYIPDDLSNYKLVKRGQFVMNKMKAWQGSYGISEYDGIVSPAYFVFDLHGVMPSFFHRAIRSKQYVPYFGQASDGIRVGQWDLSIPRMKEIPFAVPPPNEQEQIVRYLDSMTAKINKLIRAKKKQIALLQEQRQAIINRAVTKGLDTNVEMKDSGIDWLGEIPKKWRIPHLSFLTTKIGSGKTPRGGAEIYQESGVRFIRSQNVYFNSLVTDNLQYISESIDATMPSTRVLKDDVLLNITGASIGRCCVYRSELRANVNQHVCIIRCRKDLILPDYLASVLFSRVGQEAISHCQNEGNRDSLTFPQIGAFFIPLPSIEEQQQILDFVAGRVKPIEDVVKNINKEIDTLNEYRNSLISSVVTGQTDVRNIIVDHVEQNELTTEFDNMSNDLDNPIQESEETNDYWN